MSPVGLPPGFRFHPTDEELVVYYLKRKINRYSIELDVIPEVDLYKCEPWELPAKSFLPSKDHEWFFFSPLDRKYPNGLRTNRATKAGYWKATGKDRKVSSQKCEVGMKKTLVYYKGRAPHGLRTEWIMHEYRLHEKECENSPGLQDLYSLCRVFKKTTPTPKIIEQFPASYGEQLHSMCNDSSPTIELSSDGRYDAYPFTPDTCSLETLRGSPFYSSAPKDSEWMQFLADDALNSFATPSSNLNMLPCIPSDVDVASECAKLQHRLSLPTLELEDFPHIDVMDSRALQFGIPQENMNQGDIFQGFINSRFEDVWTGSHSHFDEYEHITDLSTRPDNFKFGPANNFGHPRALLSDQTRLLEISGIEEEFKEENKMPENLRAVNMLGSDKKMASLEENQQNPMDSVFQMYQSEVEAEGEKNEYNSNFELHNISNNYIYPQYQFDPSPSGLINNRRSELHTHQNYNVYDATQSQRVDVNHSLFRSSCGIAETIFHYIEPLRKVIVVEKSILPPKDNERMPSLFRKMRESIQGKFMAMKFSMKACKRSFSHKSTVNDLLSLTTGLLASCIYLGDSSEQAVLRKGSFQMLSRE